MNILLITVDDMNYNSIGAYGCLLDNCTPNIDNLATEGIRFTNAHVPIAVCQPSRSALMTGRYPHRNGARGFEKIDEDIVTLTERLRLNGFYNGIIGKEDHLAPKEKFAWDEYIRTYNDEYDYGRNPDVYFKITKEFIHNAKQKKQPFFLMANIHDPHRPFAQSEEELEFFGRHVNVDHIYDPSEIKIPDFLPDLPEVRTEIAQYYTSVRRADQSVGRILEALDSEGMREDTFVLFLSDNGMAFPFAKTNCYLNSTKSPWIMRLPGKIQENTETEALVSGIDFMPTVLELLDIPQVEGQDGKSLKELILGNSKHHYDTIYTQFFKTAKNQITLQERHYPMRCVQNKQYAYIYNAWSNSQPFMNESMSGLTFKAMKKAALVDETVARRVEFCEFRCREELYDFENDPDALNNLIDVPELENIKMALRRQMRDYIETTNDEILGSFNKDFK